MRKLWSRFKTETSRLIVVTLASLLLGGISATLLAGWNVIILPVTNEKAVEALAEQDSVLWYELRGKISEDVFHDHKRDFDEHLRETEIRYEAMNDKLDMIINSQERLIRALKDK